MNRDPRVLLVDVARAGADIQSFIEGMERATYLRDAMTQAAVERKFEIIGEALTRLHKADPDIVARISDLRRIIDFRNLLAHAYHRVAPENVWDYALNDLPNLLRIVNDLLAEFGPLEE